MSFPNEGGASNIATDLLTMLNGSGNSSSAYGSGSAQYGSASVGYNTESSANYGSSSAASGEVLSQIELQILRSLNPIEVNETEEINVIGQRGIWVNRAEVNAWRGNFFYVTFFI